MTREEKKLVMDYINRLNNKIDMAKNCIRDMNYGTAEQILAKPLPKLEINIDE